MAFPKPPARHREDLIEAMAAVEEAAGSGDPRPDLNSALGHLAGTFQRHMMNCEGAQGMLAAVESDAPRLMSDIEQLRKEHLDLREAIRAFRLRLGIEGGLTQGTREEVLALLDLIAAHDQREVTLMLDAYNVDVGVGD